MKHISAVALILGAGFVSVAWGQQPICTTYTAWAQFHRSDNMRRSNPCENVLKVRNVKNLRVKWSFTTGKAVGSSPAAANGVVYIGSDDNNLYALNAKTGAKLWSYKTGSYVESSPAVANGVVYVSGRTTTTCTR